MAKRRLKYNIVSSFMILLFFGMILTDLVVVSFWQREILRNEIGIVRLLLRSITETSSSLGRDNIREFYKIITSSADNTEIHIDSIVLLEGNKYSFFSKKKPDESFLNLVHLSYVTKENNIRYWGSTWTILGLRRRYVGLAFPFVKDVKHNASLGVLLDLKPLYNTVYDKQKHILIYILVNTAILSVLGLFRMVRFFLKPLANVVRLSETYSNTDSFVFPFDSEGDEFNKLAISLNTMLNKIERDKDRLKATITALELTNKQLKESRAEVVTAEKMAAVGILSAGMAHEIGNPLSVIQGYLELLNNENLSNSERKDFVRRGLVELARVDGLIRQLLLFSRSVKKVDDVGSLLELLAELEERISFHSEFKNLNYFQQIEIEEDVLVNGCTALMQVLLNCILNAKDAVRQNGLDEKWVKLTCTQEYSEIGRSDVKISIADNGVGIPSEVLSNIFDPFYTTKEPGKGTGLGLSISYTLLNAVNGKIHVESVEGKGSVFHIFVPVHGKKK